MSKAEFEDRCRLVLVTQPGDDVDAQGEALSQALSGGDVATVIVPQAGRDNDLFQTLAEKLVPIAQEKGVAVIIAGDSRVAGRARADGLHVEGATSDAAEAIEKFAPKLIVGIGNAKDRHGALERGELRPDYIFFGKLDGDIKPEANPKVLDLAEWWSAMIEIPCIAMGGTAVSSALEVAEAGGEFVALGKAIFDHPSGPAAAVQEVNALLAEKAPRFSD